MPMGPSNIATADFAENYAEKTRRLKDLISTTDKTMERYTGKVKDLHKATKSLSGGTVELVAKIHSALQVTKMLGDAMGKLSLMFRNFFQGAITSAIDLGEQVNRLNQVFNKLGRMQIENFTDAVARGFALSRVEAVKMTASIADMGQTLGLSQKSALKFSGLVIQLAGDLTSLQNRIEGTTTTAEALQAGVFGMTRRLRQMQISTLKTSDRFKELRDAFMAGTEGNMEVVLKGISKAAGENGEVYAKLAKQYFETEALSKKAAEALAQLVIAYEQSIPALGDFARTQEEAANSIRAMKSALVDIKTVIGDYILNQLQLGKIISALGQGLLKMAIWFREAGSEIKGLVAIGIILAALISTLVATMTALLGVVVAVMAAIMVVGWPYVLAALGAIIQLTAIAIGVFGGLLAALTALGDGFTIMDRLVSGVSKVINFVIELTRWIITLGSIVWSVASPIISAFGDIAYTIWQIIKAVGELIMEIPILGSIIRGVAAVLVGAFGIIKSTIIATLGFLQNFWTNAEIHFTRLILLFEATASLVEGSINRIIVSLQAMGEALTGNFAKADRMMAGLPDLTEEFEKKMGKFFEFYEKNELRFDFKLKELPDFKTLLEQLKELGKLSGEGDKTTEFKPPSAVVEGSVEAANLIAQRGSGSAEDRTAKASEETAAAVHRTNDLLDIMNNEGIPIKNMGIA